MYKIGFDELQGIISRTHFANDGDSYERDYGALVIDRFPNCEIFWSHFVVPLTKRIELQVKDPGERSRFREGISHGSKDIASLHYSTFINLIYAWDHLRNFRLSSFEDFYIHLATSCDLGEEFLLKTYLLILECRGQKSRVFQGLSKEEFLELAGRWYEKNYSRLCEEYLQKGKRTRIELPSGENALDEFFQGFTNWRRYKDHSRKIREYRNVIVHDVMIGKILHGETGILVPKKEKIQKYKKWAAIFEAAKDRVKLKNDFVEMGKQMKSDIEELETLLNELWDKVIEDLERLFFNERNAILLQKYNINLL